MRFSSAILLIISLLLPLIGFSQRSKSLTPDSEKAAYYNELAINSGNIDSLMICSQQSLDYCKDSDYEIIASNYYNIGKAYYLQNSSKEALGASFKALSYYKKINAKSEIAKCYILVAKCYLDINNKDSIFSFFNNALDIYTELNDTTNLAYTYQSIGAVNADLGYYTFARSYYAQALHLDSLTKNYLEVAFDYQNLAFIEREIGSMDTALDFLNKSVEIFDTTHTEDPYYIYSKYTTYIGLVAAYISCAKDTNKKEYADSCYYYIQKIGDYYLDSGNYSSELLRMLYYGEYLSFCGNNKEALDILLDCKKYLDDSDGTTVFSQFYSLLSEVYEKLGDYKNAMENYKRMHEFQISYANDSTMNVIASFKAEQEGKIQQEANRRLELEKTQLQTTIWSLVVGLVLAVLLVFFIVRALTIKHRANEQLSEANRKIYRSIVYAERIQKAAIPSQKEIDRLFPDNFVFYRPRDIVSGDFYHVAQCGRYRVLVTADCTGHGIPGAFLSMLGISALKEFCVTEEDAANPGTILDRMRIFIKSTLMSSTESAIGDGMDMTICSFDFAAMEMRYAAANQVALLVRGGEVTKLKGDNMPVGRYVLEREHFTTRCLTIEKGDMLYSFSDGIQDQPGGEITTNNEELAAITGKKFSSKALEGLLKSNYTKSLDVQCNILDETLTRWRNGRPLIDDMTLIGIRV